MPSTEPSINRVQHSDAPRRILVRSTNWLGDSVMTLPALRKLRRAIPNAEISILAKPNLLPLFESSGLVNNVVPYETNKGRLSAFRSTVRRLYSERFDTAVLLQGAFEAALMTALARIPARYGFAIQGRSFLLTHPVAAKQSSEGHPVHQGSEYLRLIDAVVGSEPQPSMSPTDRDQIAVSPEIVATRAQIAAALELLGRHGVQPDAGPLVIMNAGATNSRAKCWPEEHFAQLADFLLTSLATRVLFIGSQDERQIAQHVISLMKSEAGLNFAGLTDLSSLIGLLSFASVVISNDTGPAHVAAALGRPTLTIFGPTNEFETAPRGPRAEIIRAKGIRCERCMLRECPIDHRCMHRISAGEVFERAIACLS